MRIGIPTEEQLKSWKWPDTVRIFYVKPNKHYIMGEIFPLRERLKLPLRPYLEVDFQVQIGTRYQVLNYFWTGVDNNILLCESFLFNYDKYPSDPADTLADSYLNYYLGQFIKLQIRHIKRRVRHIKLQAQIIKPHRGKLQALNRRRTAE